MRANTITCGQLRQLLAELGFARQQSERNKQFDVFQAPETDFQYVLPRWKDHRPARESDIKLLRLQLDYLGLVEKVDFDTYFAKLTPAKS